MASASRILLVDDDPTSIAVLRRTLTELGQLRFATSGAEALRLARQAAPDLVVLDIEMPGMSGFEVCAAMKADDALRDVPLIFITGHDSMEQEITGLTLGASDFIAKPLRPALVAARVRTQLTMKAMADALRQAAATDALTGVANRRRFEDALRCEWARAQRSRAPLSLLMIDVDHFKAYNDGHGHRAGDVCLTAVAGGMAHAALRSADLLARYGGEEFALLLPDTDHDGAATVAQRVLAEVDRLALPHASSTAAGHVTVSVGGATWRFGALLRPIDVARAAAAVSELVVAADRALYAAKRAGRHRAELVLLDDAAGNRAGNGAGPAGSASSEPAGGEAAPDHRAGHA